MQEGLLSLVVEHSLCKRKVGGSIPPVGFCESSAVLTVSLSWMFRLCPFNLGLDFLSLKAFHIPEQNAPSTFGHCVWCWKARKTVSLLSDRRPILPAMPVHNVKLCTHTKNPPGRHAMIILARTEYDPTIIDERFPEHSDISTPLSEFRNLGRRSAVVTR